MPRIATISRATSVPDRRREPSPTGARNAEANGRTRATGLDTSDFKSATAMEETLRQRQGVLTRATRTSPWARPTAFSLDQAWPE